MTVASDKFLDVEELPTNHWLHASQSDSYLVLQYGFIASTEGKYVDQGI
jgi:hypothetical protein